MKKSIIISAICLIFIIGLSGCGKKEKISSEDSKAVQYSTLSEWLKSGQGVECKVNSPDGEITVKTKDQKVRMDGIMYADINKMDENTEIEKGSSIATKEWIYIWSGDKGMKMNLEEMKKLGEEMSGDQFDEEDYSWENWAKEMQEQEVAYECKEKNISNNEFEVPEDIEFIDWTEMMKGFADFGSSLMDNSNSTSSVPDIPNIEGTQDMNQEEIEALLEQMNAQVNN